MLLTCFKSENLFLQKMYKTKEEFFLELILGNEFDVPVYVVILEG